MTDNDNNPTTTLAAFMRLALRQFMEEHVVRLVLAAGAEERKEQLDQLGTWLIAVGTNMRIALDGMDRIAGAAQTLTEQVGTSFDRFDTLRIEIEKRTTTLIGYAETPPPENTKE